MLRDQMKGWDLAAETEESAIYYIGDGYKGMASRSKQEFFERLAKLPEELRQGFFREMSFNPADKRMLDIGCGAGRLTRAFANIFGEAHGVDFSSNMIRVANELNKDKPNIYFKVNNGVDLSVYDDSFFDFCFSHLVFQHIPRFEIVAKYIKEIDRVLKPNGLFMFQINTSRWRRVLGPILFPNSMIPFLAKVGLMRLYCWLKIRDPVMRAVAPRSLLVYYTPPRRLEAVLRDTALDVVKITGPNRRHTWYCGKKRSHPNVEPRPQE